MFSIIAAVGKNNELGKNGELVFHIKEDMQYFKATTMGHPVFMGSTTFRSIGRALPGRKNYVLTHDPAGLPEGVVPITDLDQFVHENLSSDEEIFVIGGANVYRQMLPYATNLYLTEIDAAADADAFFPDFDKSLYNKTITKRGMSDDLTYAFAKYTKIN
ncbi:dihydrofolate reductase [Candidatus Saccharibacteria bacterium]|nr:dihydrofolate reductase [Candidatus Saccharibacteria bacterium]